MIFYIVWTVVMILLLIPAVAAALSRKLTSRGSWMDEICEWIWIRLPMRIRQMNLWKGCMAEAAKQLYPGAREDVYIYRHQIHKVKMIYGGCLAAMLFLMCFHVSDRVALLTDSRIQRSEADGSSQTVSLDAEIGGKKSEVTLEVEPRIYTEEEEQALVKQVMAYIDEQLPGENASLEDVDKPLNLVESYPGENITIDWMMEDYDLITQEGDIGDLSEVSLPAKTSVTATIYYSADEFEYKIPVIITGKEVSEETALLNRITEALRIADEASENESFFILPDQVGEDDVTWTYHHTDMTGIVTLLAGMLILLLLYYQEEKIQEEMKQRKADLQYAYPGFVHRMVLLLGAGMTVRHSFEMIIEEYEKNDFMRNEEKYLYAELKYAFFRMRSGMPEVQVYQDFGARTGLPCYMKFCQLLNQMLKKGSKGMQEMMVSEAEEAQRQRQNLARKAGEAAGTKLLVPMMLLLCVVMLIIMVPAFMSM